VATTLASLNGTLLPPTITGPIFAKASESRRCSSSPVASRCP
jgi:hypothetical protein